MAPPPSQPLPMVPDPLGFDGATSPCRANSCRACCFDTEMPLLSEDLDRLQRVTGRDPGSFSVADPETGGRRLANEDGHCVFLDTAGCTVYADRPAGCRIYPLVHDPDREEGVLDEDCPYRGGFRIRENDRTALRSLVDALERM